MSRRTSRKPSPAYDAFEAQYDDPRKPMVSAFIGIQSAANDPRATKDSGALRALLGLAAGPDVVEQGIEVSTAGRQTLIYLCYWRAVQRFEGWHTSQGFREWLLGNPEAPVGRWIEHAHVHPTHLDTLLADRHIYWGLAKLSDRVDLTPFHGYWGGTRDRIRVSEGDPLNNADGPVLKEPNRQARGYGQVVNVVMPANVVVARGGPDWSKSTGDELRIFEESVHPAFLAGGSYLKANPEEAGCYATYLVAETDQDGRLLKREHQIAYFVQLSDLERWTKSHPTHVAIFGKFTQMIRDLGHMPAVNLYHEVSVIPAGGLRATYVNCAPETGLLRFADRQEHHAVLGDAGTE